MAPRVVAPRPLGLGETEENRKEQSAATHEIGHLFGLGDEYLENANPKYAKGLPTEHSKLAKERAGVDVAHGPNDGSIMNQGNEIRPEHGVTFLGALEEVTQMK